MGADVVKKYTAGCAQCPWSDEFDEVAERSGAGQRHFDETGHGVIGLGEVPDWLLEKINARSGEGTT